ncbi:hypothetical protein RvY_04165 [Ramazzottius varieornatus]|uniref:Uncharacterized protein n=1 Tax=Ramazzottius varieornatus TaxID=947166 RepID=A0A1D1UU78_RAMVA|nr:hypothetical protein RvY_04165 [Ramazzottius varieornatus]
MDSVNPLNVLEDDYKQFFQLDDQPSEADKQLKTLVKGIIADNSYKNCDRSVCKHQALFDRMYRPRRTHCAIYDRGFIFYPVGVYRRSVVDV